MKQTKDDVSKLMYINGNIKRECFGTKGKGCHCFPTYMYRVDLELNDMYLKESRV